MSAGVTRRHDARTGRLRSTACLLALLAAPRAGRAAAADDSLTMTECMRLARLNAPSVRAAAQERVAASGDSLSTSFARRPSFAAVGGVLVAPAWSYDPVITNLGEYQLKLAMDWPLLDGGERARAVARGRLDAGGAGLALALAEREAAARAGALAAEVLRLREHQALGRDALAWLDRLASLLASGTRAGAQARSDELRVSIERDGVVAALEDATRESAAAERELAWWIGATPERVRSLRPPAPEATPAPADADSAALVEAAERDPAVTARRTASAAATLSLEAAERRRGLSMALSADAGLAGGDLTHAVPPDLRAEQPSATFADRLRRDLGASAAITLRRPLADPSAGGEIGARRADLAAAETRTRAELESARRDRIDLVARWRSAGRRYDAARAASERTADHLLRMRSLHAGGGATLLELLDARELNDQALERQADARADLRLAELMAEILR